MEEALMISIKNGDIKCDVGEVRFLLYIVEQMNQLINKYAVGEDKTEREKIKKFIEYYEYFKDKYLVLQEIRNQENFYFNQMKAWQKKLNESSDENMKKLILESANEYQTKYKKLKKKRECLCKELEKLKKEKYSDIPFIV
jgi:aspartyl-tRNA synthetase